MMQEATHVSLGKMSLRGVSWTLRCVHPFEDEPSDKKGLRWVTRSGPLVRRINPIIASLPKFAHSDGLICFGYPFSLGCR